MQDTGDISKMISILMQNPDIIERVKALAEKTEDSKNFGTVDSTELLTESNKEDNNTANLKEESNVHTERDRRQKLLSAIKPYLSRERGKAIDTMLSVIEVFDIIKAR